MTSAVTTNGPRIPSDRGRRYSGGSGRSRSPRGSRAGAGFDCFFSERDRREGGASGLIILLSPVIPVVVQFIYILTYNIILSIHPQPFLELFSLVSYNTFMSKRALEQYRIFPFIAWGLVIGFSLFVYSLTTELTATQAELAERTAVVKSRTTIDPASITDFTP